MLKIPLRYSEKWQESEVNKNPENWQCAEEQILEFTFIENFNVSNTLFCKNGPNFEALENFLENWSLLGKNLSNFVYPQVDTLQSKAC